VQQLAAECGSAEGGSHGAGFLAGSAGSNDVPWDRSNAHGDGGCGDCRAAEEDGQILGGEVDAGRDVGRYDEAAWTPWWPVPVFADGTIDALVRADDLGNDGQGGTFGGVWAFGSVGGTLIVPTAAAGDSARWPTTSRRCRRG
jgi:hypothetical protein